MAWRTDFTASCRPVCSVSAAHPTASRYICVFYVGEARQDVEVLGITQPRSRHFPSLQLEPAEG